MNPQNNPCLTCKRVNHMDKNQMIMNRIVFEVSEAWGVSPNDLRERTNKPRYTEPYHAAVKLTDELTDLSPDEIMAYFNRSRSMFYRAKESISKLEDVMPKVQQKMATVRKKMNYHV